MGLTVGCARCHDHKYDPIGTHDYYAIAGIFNNSNYYEYPVADSATASEFKREQEFIEEMEEGLGRVPVDGVRPACDRAAHCRRRNT